LRNSSRSLTAIVNDHPKKQKMLGQTGINRNNVHEFPNSHIKRKSGSD